jgi:hypothetical protein
VPVSERQGSPPTPTKPGRNLLPSGFSTVRDLLSFVAGLAVIANEVWISKTAEPTVIAVGIAMLGLPAVFGADEKKKSAPPAAPEAPAAPAPPAPPAPNQAGDLT